MGKKSGVEEDGLLRIKLSTGNSNLLIFESITVRSVVQYLTCISPNVLASSRIMESHATALCFGKKFKWLTCYCTVAVLYQQCAPPNAARNRESFESIGVAVIEGTTMLPLAIGNKALSGRDEEPQMIRFGKNCFRPVKV